MNIISLLISSLLQLVIFSLIPLVWWFATARKNENFFHWLGFKQPLIKNKNQFFLIFLFSIFLFDIPTVIIPIFVDSSNLATSQFSGLGISAFIPAIIYSFVQTGLSEELFFRGFINKRLCSKWGFNCGNFIQSISFGGLHGSMVHSLTGGLGAMIVFVFTGSVAWLMGWINEKKSEGSIIPSWILHSIANFIMSLLAMFSII